MRLLSVQWRPRRSFWQGLARWWQARPLAKCGARGRLLPRPEVFETLGSSLLRAMCL